jgi:hypothetical protein
MVNFSQYVYNAPSGLFLPKVADSTAGTTQVNSNSVVWEGTAWDTDNTVSRTMRGRIYNYPTSGTTIGGILTIGFSTDGAAYSDKFYFYNGGSFTAASTISNSNGTYGSSSTTSVILNGAMADGATSIGVISNNTTTLTNAAAEIHEFRNNGTKKSFIDLNGLFGWIAGNTQATVGAAGAASALPGAPTGYAKVNIGGTVYVMPYWAAA